MPALGMIKRGNKTSRVWTRAFLYWFDRALSDALRSSMLYYLEMTRGRILHDKSACRIASGIYHLNSSTRTARLLSQLSPTKCSATTCSLPRYAFRNDTQQNPRATTQKKPKKTQLDISKSTHLNPLTSPPPPHPQNKTPPPTSNTPSHTSTTPTPPPPPNNLPNSPAPPPLPSAPPPPPQPYS